MFASVKPVRSYPNLPSLQKNVDIVFVREVTEGMQYSGTVVAGSGEFRPNDEISIGTRVVTRKGANRVAREAFEWLDGPVMRLGAPDVPAAAFARPMMDRFVPSAEKIEEAMLELARY